MKAFFFFNVRMAPLFTHKYNVYLSGFAKTWLKKFLVHFYNLFDIQVKWKLVFKSHQLRLNNDKFVIAGNRWQISLAEVTVLFL